MLETVLDNVDLMYIVSCNAATYFITTMVDSARKKKLKTWSKRLIATIVAILIGLAMYFWFQHPVEPLFYGIFVQFVTWDYLFKPIVKGLASSGKLTEI